MRLISDSFELDITIASLFIRALGYEVYLHSDKSIYWGYFRDSETERALSMGKLRVLVSSIPSAGAELSEA